MGSFAMHRSSSLLLGARDSADRRCREAQMKNCELAAASFYRFDAVRRLWLLRHHYMVRLIGLRYNVLMLDSDSLVLADPYPLIRTHLPTVVALCLSDETAGPHMRVNGGTWYVQNARPGGAVHGVFADFVERALAILSEYPALKHFETIQRNGAPFQRPADFLLFDQVRRGTAPSHR